MLAILEYGAGNQTSVQRALTHLGIESVITADPATLLHATGVIFPGVGAAGQAMERLTQTGLDAVLRQLVENGVPLLGICLGCQILLDSSEEGGPDGQGTQTLGIIPGLCKRFPAGLTDNEEPLRVPHMGWNRAVPSVDCVLFSGIERNAQFYFVHGYYPAPAPEYALATTEYGLPFPSVFGRPGLWAVQFHPEKSGRPGLQLLNNFNEWCMDRRAKC